MQNRIPSVWNWCKIALQKLGLRKSSPNCTKPRVSGSTSKNPYELIYYKKGWSENKTRKNNIKYWQWEIDNNGFRP
jgi:hypothetical protein